jgi:hypothetical protein
MALATAMYYSGKNPLKKVTYKSEKVSVVKQIEHRRVQKAFLRFHDEKNWPLLRQTLKEMGREDMIGDAPHQLVPAEKASGRPRGLKMRNGKQGSNRNNARKPQHRR